ncbi:MAG: type II methionyl aminopeptidase [Thermoplasmata archaeon]
MDAEILEKYLRAGKIASSAIEYGKSIIKVGERTEKIADEIDNFIISKGGKPAFPVNLSRNEEAAHYSPGFNDDRRISNNDIIKLDLGVHIDGYIADTAISIDMSGKNEKLLNASRHALENVARNLRPGITLNDIGEIIENSINFFNYKPIYNLTGHQLDRYILHTGMSFPNYPSGEKDIVKNGMAFAIEPFATDGMGLIKEGKFGNILMLMDEKEFPEVYEKYLSLPFSVRWVYRDFSQPEKIMEKLMNSRKVKKFGILVEKKHGNVSQHEHTFVIFNDRIYITTLLK